MRPAGGMANASGSVDVDEPTDPGPERQGSDPIQPEMCCDCGYLTYEPVKVGEAYATGGAGRDVFACPRHAPQYLVGGAS